MARQSFSLLLLVAYSTCMEMRETVQRMVMVRTTGSDLHPAATGFIYKKESDGPPSVVEMGESEIMEKLTKLYEQPKSFAAPIPVAAGPFHDKDEEKLPSYSESKVIPVVEKQTYDDQEHIAGIANEDYKKVLGDYASKFGDYKSDFDEYLKSLGYSDDGEYRGDDADNDDQQDHKYSDKNKKEYGSQHQYETSGGANYDSGKYESYATSGEGDQKKSYDGADGLGGTYSHDYKSDYPTHGAENDQSKADDGFHDLFDKTEYENDHVFDDGEKDKNGYHKLIDRHGHHESGGASEEGVGDEPGFQEDDFGKGSFHVEPSDGQRKGRSPEGGDKASPRHGILGTDFSSSYHYKITH